MKQIKLTITLLGAFYLAIISSLPLLADEDLANKSLEEILAMKHELKAGLGTREKPRNFMESLSPLDVITFDQIDRSGLTSLTSVLRYFIAGFNAPETSVADGSDHVTLATLRGLSPDQILVLVNGKRLHTSSLLYVNGVIGRGSSGVDLDTISVKAIEKIEVLRDGAAAQYGSDAIAGVINIVLKGIGHEDSLSLSVGQRDQGDGQQNYIESFFSFPLRYEGFVNLTLSAVSQKQTQRAGKDPRLSPPSVQTHVGIPDSQNLRLTLNAEVANESDLTFYSSGILNYRDSEASAFFRIPDPTRETRPEGFLPIIHAEIIDQSLTVGLNGQFGKGYFWDLSNVYGYNSFEFAVTDSANYSLGNASPTSFENGKLSFVQNTTNFDIRKSFGNLGLAGGLEYRYENYQIESGELTSYTGSGSQGFAGFKPENETDSDRNSYALYANITKKFDTVFLEGAARYEDYSDFGSTTNFKVALGYKVVPELLLRTTASTGFRAPSLAQTSYSQTSSFADTVTNKLSIQGTFTPSHDVAQALGARELTAETSEHFTVGGVYQMTDSVSMMLDFFYTEVDDRINLSNELKGNSPEQIQLLAENNVAKARFFNNAAQTETKGADFKLNYSRTLKNNSKLNLSAWYNYSKNKLFYLTPDAAAFNSSFEQIERFENGQPKSNIRVVTHYEISKYDFTVNVSKFGSYNQVISNVSYPFEADWTVDLDIKYKLTNSITVALGAINIFSEKPNKWKNLAGDLYGTNGVKPYSRYSPFGYSGAYYYFRAQVEF